MKKIAETFKARRAAKCEAENGFSLIDVVVTVAIIVALSVGGFIAYNDIVTNAQKAAVQGAADQVYTAAMTAYNSGGASAGLEDSVEDVVTQYNESNDTIEVSVNFGDDDEFTITAVDTKHDGIEASRGPADATPAPGGDTDGADDDGADDGNVDDSTDA